MYAQTLTSLRNGRLLFGPPSPLPPPLPYSPPSSTAAIPGTAGGPCSLIAVRRSLLAWWLIPCRVRTIRPTPDLDGPSVLNVGVSLGAVYIARPNGHDPRRRARSGRDLFATAPPKAPSIVPPPPSCRVFAPVSPCAYTPDPRHPVSPSPRHPHALILSSTYCIPHAPASTFLSLAANYSHNSEFLSSCSVLPSPPTYASRRLRPRVQRTATSPGKPGDAISQLAPRDIDLF